MLFQVIAGPLRCLCQLKAVVAHVEKNVNRSNEYLFLSNFLQEYIKDKKLVTITAAKFALKITIYWRFLVSIVQRRSAWKILSFSKIIY